MAREKTQLKRLKQAACELGTNEHEDRFNEKLKKRVKQMPEDKESEADA